MSRENVEVVRRAFEALAAEDWVTLAEFFAEDCEIHDFDIPDADVYRGPEGVLDWLAHWDTAWENWSVHDLDLRAAGDHRVLALFRLVAKGRGSGLELNRQDGVVYTVDRGKLSRLEYYPTKAAALEAVGLRD